MPPPEPIGPERFPQLAERKTILGQLFEEAEIWLARAHVATATQAFTNLRRHYIVRQAISRDHILYDDTATPDGESLFVCLVAKPDIWLLEPDDPIATFATGDRWATMYAAYYRETRSIFLSLAWEVPPRWLAFLLIHESVHAWEHHQGTPAETSADFDDEERRVQAIEWQLLKGALPGAAFGQLQALADKIPASASWKSCASTMPTQAELSDETIDTWLGRSSSVDEVECKRRLLSRGITQLRHSN